MFLRKRTGSFCKILRKTRTKLKVKGVRVEIASTLILIQRQILKIVISTMPYILVRCCMIPSSSGYGSYPTLIDYHAEGGEQGEFKLLQDVMSQLEASRLRVRRDPYCSYQIPEPPYLVLNRLESHGYKVVAANSVACDNGSSVWQMWTLHKQK